MGTNFYLTKRDACEHCERSDPDLHIGKSSGGWTFSFRGYDEIQSWEDWQERLGEGVIVDEYGREMTSDDFKDLVQAKADAKFNHTVAMRKEFPQSSHFDAWLDDEGHSFSGHEFS